MPSTPSAYSQGCPPDRHPVDQRLPNIKLAALGLQHVLVMYAGAVAVPLIIGRALQLSAEEVAMLISADLFCCGLITLIQTLGATRWFGIQLPVMMGVTFASVAPMAAMATAEPGPAGAQLLFGSIIGAGVVSILIAPAVSRMLRFFPPVVTGTIIAVIGITLMRVGINWIFGNPVGPTAPAIVDPAYAKWLADVTAPGGQAPPLPQGFAIQPSVPNPKYADPVGLGIAAVVLLSILLIVKYARGFVANISVLLGIVVGAIAASAAGIMTFEKMDQAAWFDIVLPFHFGMPRFDIMMILTMSLIMVVVMIESTGMFLALGSMTSREITQKDLAPGPAHRRPGHAAGRHLQHLSVHQLLAERGAGRGDRRQEPLCLRRRRADPAGAGPAAQDRRAGRVAAHRGAGRAGIVMFGMVAATGIRILSGVDFKTNRNNAMIVAVSIGIGMVPLIAPHFKQWMPHSVHPLVESGILLSSVTAVLLNLF